MRKGRGEEEGIRGCGGDRRGEIEEEPDSSEMIGLDWVVLVGVDAVEYDVEGVG